ncbi:MAG: hypothetical protein KA902_02515 [Arenimonas sp.]|nr:hypothetical protein [Arenimonas sp.]
MSSDINSFVALCLLASKERWCWNLICTTCGHMQFRYAFKEIAKGVHPGGEYWTVHQNNRDDFKRLGEMPRTFGIEDQRTLISIFSSASIATIAKECTFPAWLGYLGLALRYTEIAESESRILTLKWIPQILELTHQGHSAQKMLREIQGESRRVLSWLDLEEVELAITTH